jgi:hypothetical protein
MGGFLSGLRHLEEKHLLTLAEIEPKIIHPVT